MKSVTPQHGDDHRANGPNPQGVLLHVPVFAETKAVTTGNGKRTFTITPDLGGTHVRAVWAVVYGAPSSDLEVMLHNLTEGNDVLVSPVVVGSGDLDSYETPAEIDTSGDPPTNRVSRGDKLRVDVDDDGGATGLELQIEFGPAIIRLTP